MNHEVKIELLEKIEPRWTILDLGCGTGRYSLDMPNPKTLVDHWGPSLDKVKHKCQTLRLTMPHGLSFFRDASYDAVLLLDVVRFLTKEKGSILLAEAERISRKVIFVMTPVGFYPEEMKDDNPLTRALSGYERDEFLLRGYQVKDIQGTNLMLARRDVA